MRNDERTVGLLEDLRRLGEPDTRDERFREVLAHTLRTSSPGPDAVGRPAGARYSRVRRRQRFATWGERRPGSLAAPAGALVVLVLVTTLLLGGRGGASAEVLLRRAAAIKFQPDQARHLVYDVTMTLHGRVATGTGEIWIATNAAGKPVQATETLRMAKTAGARQMVVERDQQTALGIYTYDGTHNAVVIPSGNDPAWTARSTPTLPLPVYLFDGATAAQRVADLLAHGAVRAQVLPSRVIGGTTVAAVRVNGWPSGASVTTTLYFDVHTHLLRGFDSRGTDPAYNSPVWRVRLAKQTSMPRETAPADALALEAPAGAQVQPPLPAIGVLPRLCRRQPKLLLGSGKPLLETCQMEHPGLTESALVAALVGGAPRDLAAAVRAGAINRMQADAALQMQRRQILTMLMSSRPLVKAAPGK